jgi:hypothetical protein
MTIYELRLLVVVGLLALGAAALLAAFAMTKLKDFAASADTRMAASRAMSTLRGDTRETARLIDRRQAAWRLRC